MILRRVFLGIALLLSLSLLAIPASAEPKSAKTKGNVKQVTKKAQKKQIKKNNAIKPPAKGIQAKAVFCVSLPDCNTIISRNPDQQLPVASLTKLITAMVVLDTLPLSKKVTVPDYIKTVPKTVVGLKPGDVLSVNDLLHGLLIGSANDCAETLADSYPGGRQKFIAAMNQKAKQMGLTKTRFYTPSGLDRKNPDGKDEDDVDSNVSTAREIAYIAGTAFSEDIIRTICLKKGYTLASAVEPSGYTVRTTNKLLRDNLPLAGGKTGYTSRAGHCLATEFTPGKQNFLIVVLGSPDHFRDTRLAYLKALKESSRAKASPNHVPKRLAKE